MTFSKLFLAAASIAVSLTATAQSATQISMAKSMARQYGYSEAEINSVLNHNINGGSNADQQAAQNTQQTDGQATQPTYYVLTPANQETQTTTAAGTAQTQEGEMTAAELIRPGSIVDLAAEEMLPDEIFGHAYFRSEGLSIIPTYNAPAPASYVLGPGDEVSIDIWGATTSHLQTVIDNQGSVSVTEIGPVYLAGLTIKAAEESLKSQLSSIYSGLSQDDSGDTFLRLSINKIKGVTVSVTGEVSVPGAYNLPSLASIASAVFMAGGITPNGSVRNINLYRAGKKIGNFDLYELICKGTFNESFRLQENDVITVEPYNKVVTFTGSVVRPMRYELKEGETIKDLLLYAGGFTSNARCDQVNVTRDNGTSGESFDIAEANYDSFKLKGRDKVNARTKPQVLANKVSVAGPVNHPGDYAITDDLNNVAALIRAAGGLRDGVYKERGQILRLDSNRLPVFISFDLEKVVSGVDYVELQREDKVILYAEEDFIEFQTITVSGNVARPGTFRFFEGMTAADAVILAGGARSDSYRRRGQINRFDNQGVPQIISFNLDEVTKGDKVINLMREDTIRIYSVRELREAAKVRVVGEVQAKDTIFNYREGMTIEDALLVAGGFSNGADLRNIEVAGRGGREKGAVATYNLEENPEFYDTKLKPYDIVSVRRLTYYKFQTAVTVQGEVITPGTYVVNKTNVRLSDVIEKVGGFTEEAYVRGARLTRVLTQEEIDRQELAVQIANQALAGKDTIDITTLTDRYFIAIDLQEAVTKPGSKYDIILRAGDVISVPQYNLTVKVSGGVLYPNTLAFEEGLKWKDYVELSGGFTKEARKKKSYTIYMNGRVSTVKKGMIMEPGCEIVVPEKNPSENRKMSAAEVAALCTSATSVAALVTSIIKMF